MIKLLRVFAWSMIISTRSKLTMNLLIRMISLFIRSSPILQILETISTLMPISQKSLSRFLTKICSLDSNLKGSISETVLICTKVTFIRSVMAWWNHMRSQTWLTKMDLKDRAISNTDPMVSLFLTSRSYFWEKLSDISLLVQSVVSATS